MIGRTLGHYEITEKIGEGGMGAVFKARDTHLDRFVAVKVLPAAKVADPDRRRRFEQEAKSASALNHPNIVTIHDIDHADGTDFIAMEYVAGRTLAESIDRRGMPLLPYLRWRYLGSPAWSPDRRFLYYVSQRDGSPCVWAQPIAPDGGLAGAAVAALHLHSGNGAWGRNTSIGVTMDRLFVLLREVKGDIWSIQLER